LVERALIRKYNTIAPAPDRPWTWNWNWNWTEVWIYCAAGQAICQTVKLLSVSD